LNNITNTKKEQGSKNKIAKLAVNEEETVTNLFIV